MVEPHTLVGPIPFKRHQQAIPLVSIKKEARVADPQ